MSEYHDGDGIEFESPPYTVIDRWATRGKIVTAVVMDSEIQFFEMPHAKVNALSGSPITETEIIWPQN